MLEREAAVPELDQYFWNSVDLLSVFRADGLIGLTNPAWRDTLGWDAASLQGTPFIDLVHPADVERTNAESVELWSGAETTRSGFENRLRCRDGSFRSIEWTSQRRGEWVYTTGRDVTARNATRVRLDQTLATNAAVFEAVADSIVMIDREGLILDANPSGEVSVDNPPEDVIGVKVEALIHPDDVPVLADALERTFSSPTHEVVTARVRARGADGEWLIWESRGRALPTDSGSPSRAVFVSRDITESAVAAAELAESRETVTAILDAAVDSIVLIDRDFTVLSTSPAAERMHGVPQRERVGGKVADMVHPDDRQRLEKAFRKAFENDELVNVRCRLRHRDGHTLQIEVRGRPLHDTKGPPTRLVFIARDVSDIVAAERALSESLEKTQAILDSAADSIVVIDRNFVVTEASPGTARIYGYANDERVGHSALSIVEPEDKARVVESLERLFSNEGGDLVGYRFLAHRVDGQKITMETRGRLIRGVHGHEPRAVLLSRDVSDNIAAERALSESLEMSKAIFAAAADIILVVDRDNVIVDSSPSGQAILGYPDDGRIGEAALAIVHPDDLVAASAALRQVFEFGEVRTARFRARHFDGHWITLEARAQALRGAEGRLTLAVVICRDVSKAVAEEAALTDSLRKIQAIVDTAVDGIAVVQRDSTLLEVSNAAEAILGTRAQDRRGQKVLDAVHPEDRAAVAEGLRRVFDEGETVTVRFRMPHADGHWVPVESRGRALDNAGQPPTSALFISRDISDSVAAEEALDRAREEAERAKAEAERANLAKSEFLSRMSHELRTPLNSVLGFAQILQMESTAPNVVDVADQIFISGRHLLNLINEVMDISRVESGTIAVNIESVPIADVVRESVDVVMPQASGAGVTITVGDVDQGDVRADRQRLGQVLLNLLTNAVKYNRPGGSVEVSCTRTDDSVRIAVADSGYGIAPELQSRLFTPFDRLGAEAKSVEGTGLGLALSRTLMEAMGGTVDAESVEDEGSTFWVELPSADGDSMLASAPTIAGPGRR